MRLATIVALTIGVIAGAVAPSAQQATTQSPSIQAPPANAVITTPPWFQSTQQMDFLAKKAAENPAAKRRQRAVAQALEQKVGETDGVATLQPRVRCGMTLVPADPKVDPEIRHTPPADGTEFTLRGIQPQACRP